MADTSPAYAGGIPTASRGAESLSDQYSDTAQTQLKGNTSVLFQLPSSYSYMSETKSGYLIRRYGSRWAYPGLYEPVIRHGSVGKEPRAVRVRPPPPAYDALRVVIQRHITMLVPPEMMAAQSKLVYQMNKYYNERVANRKAQITKTIHEVCRIVQDVLKEVELQEPRFISSLTDYNGRFDGLEVVSPHEFEIVIYLNQMGVLNFVDDGSLPGCAVLKLSDGRKRSMSLWVEFITASGYLSARKIRSRFQTLVAQACDKCSYRDCVKMIAETTEVKLRIRERYIVQITPAFKCAGLWPRSAAHWPLPAIPWPHPNIVAEVKTEGFDLLSKECLALQGKNSAMEGDAWVLSFVEAENRLLQGGCRRKCLSILKTIRDRHLDLPGNPVTCYHMKTLLLYECEKHPREHEWDEVAIGDRINGIFLQLISSLQCRRCPHYFLPHVDLFKGKSPTALENAAKQVWRLTREMLTNSRAFEKL